MQKRYALRNIAIALVLTYKDRRDRIAVLNSLIDAKASSYRSPANVDGVPHASGNGDPVASAVVGMESVTEQRDAEQKRVDAVEWALKYVTDYQRPEDADAIVQALLVYYEDRDAAEAIIDTKTDISPQRFIAIRQTFVKQIIKYLFLS